MKKKMLLIFGLLGLVLILSGCGDINAPITAETSDIWSKYFVYPISWLITTTANLFNGSFGWGIVIVTLIIRVLLYPLNLKQMKSSQAMQDVGPELKKLREKYSSKDAATKQKLQEETMLIYREHNINPVAGCLPLFIQMPILIGLYHAIMRTPSLQDGSFLWFELSERDPYFILPLIAAAATFLQQKWTMQGSAGAEINPQLKSMMYTMPILIGVMSMFFPAALALYWAVGNIFALVQTIIIKKPFAFQQSPRGR